MKLTEYNIATSDGAFRPRQGYVFEIAGIKFATYRDGDVWKVDHFETGLKIHEFEAISPMHVYDLIKSRSDLYDKIRKASAQKMRLN